MQLSEEYRLSLYRDLGRLEDNEKIRLKRRTTDGKICVDKRVPAELRGIYHFNNTLEEQQNTETDPQETPSDKETAFGVGETAEMNDVQVTLLGYEESSGSEYNTPVEGNVFLLANFEIVNNSDQELNISSMMSFEAYADDYALNYSLNAVLEKADANQLDGTIAPGKKMNGVIGYEVPADWSEVEIHFVDNVWSSNKFIFTITK